MASASNVPTTNPPESDQPLVVRIYGELKGRVTAYGKKKGLKRSTVVKLLTGEALEREGFTQKETT